MIGEGSQVYLRRDDATGGFVYQPGIVTAMDPDRWTIDFEAAKVRLESGDERLVYFSQAGKFVQRPARVEELWKSEPLLRVVLRFTGDSTEAEPRQELRVPAVDVGLAATVGSDDSCAVHDISMSGLGVICRSKHSIGQPIDVTLRYKDDEFGGRMTVQFARAIDDERTRYGLSGRFEKGDTSPLRSGLMRTTLALHREVLDRPRGED